MASPDIRIFVLLLCTLLLCSVGVTPLANTDTITWGGDISRTGYENNHNMDPAIVGSAQFGLLYETLLPGSWPVSGQNVSEQIYSQPLVYTGSDGVQYVYIATTQNNVHKMNAKTGVIVASRNLHRPFLVSDLDGCVDINPTVGVTATGVIDPETDTLYLTAKTYIDQDPNGPTGKPNGRYYIHAISTVDLSEKSNFPVDLEGTIASNNLVRWFNGGIHHQRPALLQYGQWVYAGFASHCVQYNFTGWIVGWDKTTGQLVEQFATEGAGVANTIPGAGVWMSGGGLSSDGQGSMFFATGNGYASQLNGVPVNGRDPPTALEEAAVHMAINDDGSLTIVDFFMPWEKVQLDGADRDLGTTPLELLPSQFQCGNTTRMGVVTGKSGKTYWLDLDNLGGYQNGPNKLDDVIQVYQNENSVYAGAGVYPFEGGYIYINVIQFKTHVFQFSCTDGVASFNHIADSPENNAYILGVGHGTVTSLNNQPGTALLWTSDVEGSNLRIYNAVPQNGVLTEINSFVTPGTTKFTRPVFGDGIVYQGTTVGYIYAYGAPVNLPLNCTAPSFGTVNLNSSSPPTTVQCVANTALTVTAAALSGNPNFVLSGLSELPVQVAQGSSFSFQAVFDPSIVGPLSSSVVLNTTQQAGGFSINTPVQLRGTGQSQAALLVVTPVTVAWNGVITGQQTGGVNQSVILQNLGNTPLTISQFQFSTISETGPWLNSSQISANGSSTVISAFSFIGLPTSVPANSAVTVPINFNPLSSGNYAVYVQVTSNGGVKVFDVVATGSDYPVAVLDFQTPDGNGWVRYDNSTPFTFGNVTEGTTRYLKLRLTNNGGVNAAALSLTVSKPPFAVPGIIGANNQVDLAEGTLVYAGQNATATLYCSAPKSQINVDPYNGTAQWTMNVNDPTFDKQYIQFFCNAVSEQVPPLNPVSQQATYRYAGCFEENNPGRQLQTMIYSGANNSNENCIAMCSAAGYIFAGTQYNEQCWCGYNRPKSVFPDANCNFACTGVIAEICGGNGVDASGAYISTFGDNSRWDGNSTNTPGPYVNSGTNGFTSIGCFTEATLGRALGVEVTANNTVSSCLAACTGYLYSGVEYGGECYCGNVLGIGSTNASIIDCSMLCNNNQSEYCGGPSRLNLYVYRNSTLPNITTPTSSVMGTSSTNPPASPSVPAVINSFDYISCYTEATNGRALTGLSLADNSITLQTCASNCTDFVYFGVEYARECYCGQSLAAGSVPATDGRCNMPCSGNVSEICGGPNGLTLFSQSGNLTSISSTASPSTASSGTLSSSATVTSTPTPTVVLQAGVFQYVDCHSELPGRALIGKAVASNDMTIQNCAGNCTGFAFMAVEYGRECYCGNALQTGSASATDGRCSMVCAGDPTSICGGPNGLTLYTNTSISNLSISLSTTSSTFFSPVASNISYSSTTPSRYSNTSALPTSLTSGTTYSTSNLFTTSSASPAAVLLSTSVTTFNGLNPVLSSSTQSSTTSSTGTFGLSSLTTTPAATPPGLLTTLTTSRPASSNVSSSIGLSNSNLQYTTSVTSTLFFSSLSSSLTSTTGFSSTFSTSTLNSSSTSALSPSLATAASSLPSNTSLLPSTIAQSSSSSTFGTSSSSISTTAPNSTTSTSNPSPNPWVYLGCANETNPRALSLASTSSSAMTPTACQSYCLTQNFPFSGVEYSRECYCGAALANNSTLGYTGCNMGCAGDSTQICGGANRISVYNNTAYVAPGVRGSIGAFTYQGCYTESSPTRVLNAFVTSVANMTEEYCVVTCAARGFRYAGAEYGTQCYCDQGLGSAASLVDDGQCKMLCGGNGSEYCGAGNRLNVWAVVGL